MALSAAEREYITQGVEQNIRNDGRKREDFRAIELQLGVIAQASGSARLKLGNTDVIVGVKVRATTSCMLLEAPWVCTLCCQGHQVSACYVACLASPVFRTVSS